MNKRGQWEIPSLELGSISLSMAQISALLKRYLIVHRVKLSSMLLFAGDTGDGLFAWHRKWLFVVNMYLH